METELKVFEGSTVSTLRGAEIDTFLSDYAAAFFAESPTNHVEVWNSEGVRVFDHAFFAPTPELATDPGYDLIGAIWRALACPFPARTDADWLDEDDEGGAAAFLASLMPTDMPEEA